MGKEVFKVNFNGSGIRSLRFVSWIFAIGGIFGGFVLLFISLFTLSSYNEAQSIMLLTIGAPALILGLIFTYTLRAFAVIAENSLYQITKLKFEIEKEYTIEEVVEEKS